MLEKEKQELQSQVLQGLLGDVGDGVILTDTEEHIRYMNEAAARILGCQVETAVGRRFPSVCQLVNVKTGRVFHDPLEQAMRKRRAVGLARNIGIRRGPQQIYLSATCSPMLNPTGEVIGCSIILRDITHMRQLEMKIELDHIYMRAVFSAAKIGLCVLDARGAIININDAALEMMETTFTRVQGQQFGDAFRCQNSFECGCGHGHLCGHCPVRRHIEAAIRDDTFTTEFTVAMHSRISTLPIWLKIFVSQTATDGKKQIVLALLNDSSRKKRERALDDARMRAESASRTKSQFLANMSHEIRTPINGLTGMLDLTLRTGLTDEQRENLLNAKQCADDLLRVINDILDFSEMESGNLELEDIGFDLRQHLKRVCQIHSKITRQKGLYFRHPNYKELPPIMRGDPMRLRQIMHNLLTNATKFTQEGGITVEAHVGERRGQPTLEIAVHDTGIGMSIAEQQKLFRPFSQVDGSITRRFGGTGLGLTIVKKLITLMGGEISVHSAPTVGSNFTFWVPLITAEKIDDDIHEQRVFLNPRLTAQAASGTVQGTEMVVGQHGGTVQAGAQAAAAPTPEIAATAKHVADLDIASLMRYCEQKLDDAPATAGQGDK